MLFKSSGLVNIFPLNNFCLFRKILHWLKDILDEIKYSSILLAIGFVRIFFFYESDSIYGKHWNALFTIFLVKVVSTGLQILLKRCPIRTFAAAAILACSYQYMLSVKGYTSYLLDESVASHKKPAVGQLEKLVEENKEGLFSSIGYLAIYLGTQSIYYQLASIIHTQ